MMNMLRFAPKTGFLLFTQKTITSCLEKLQVEKIKTMLARAANNLIDFIDV